jgi:aminoglycoside phosphotransferase (APT) family kinase protein
MRPMPGLADKDLLAAVRSHAGEAMGFSPERVTAVSRFEEGNRHSVHRVSYLDTAGVARDVVVRVFSGGDPADCARGEHEAAVLRLVGGAAAPELYDFRCTSRWFDVPVMCLQYVPGDPRELRSTRLEDIGSLASVVAWVHQRPVDDLVGPLARTATIVSYAHDRLRSILSTLAWARDPLPAALQARLKRAADSVATSFDAARDTQSFATHEGPSLLHGDIGPGNVLWGAGPVLIDWEYTRLGDPADEIAYLFDQNQLTDPQRQAFWDGYRHGVTTGRLAHVIDRVSWWEPVTLLGSALWWVERWVRRTEAVAVGGVDPAVPREPDYYLDHVVRRLARLEKAVTPASDPTPGQN